MQAGYCEDDLPEVDWLLLTKRSMEFNDLVNSIQGQQAMIRLQGKEKEGATGRDFTDSIVRRKDQHEKQVQLKLRRKNHMQRSVRSKRSSMSSSSSSFEGIIDDDDLDM